MRDGVALVLVLVVVVVTVTGLGFALEKHEPCTDDVACVALRLLRESHDAEERHAAAVLLDKAVERMIDALKEAAPTDPGARELLAKWRAQLEHGR